MEQNFSKQGTVLLLSGARDLSSHFALEQRDSNLFFISVVILIF